MGKILLDRNRLIFCREKLGLSKKEAAKRVGISQPAYLRYESGARIPSIHIVKAMADTFHTSVEYLTGQTENEMPTSYLVKESTDPQLFHLIEIYMGVDHDSKERLSEYFNKLT